MIEAFATMGVRRFEEIERIAKADCANGDTLLALRSLLAEVHALRAEAREQSARVNGTREALIAALRVVG